ncbi:MAG: beta-ketoacyl synthase chain length factor [Chitinophagaceae bacterium]
MPFDNKLYILSSACISPQKNFNEELHEETLINYTDNRLVCLHPDYKAYINPVQIRRMSYVLKMGFCTALACLQKTTEIPVDAIICATGKGSMFDTEAFLHAIRDYQETALNATHFIHSTYNQVSGLVAMNKKINSYNITYVHRGFSFENAMIDAMLQAEVNEDSTTLLGTFDEMTAEHFEVKSQWDYWKKEKINSLALHQHCSKGTIAGEGAAFFLLSNKPIAQTPFIMDCKTLYETPATNIVSEIDSFLKENNMQASKIDLLMLGENGNIALEESFSNVVNHFRQAIKTNFKHLCGEYDTAVSFALTLVKDCLCNNSVPSFLCRTSEDASKRKDLRYALIYNNYFHQNQSLILMGI